MPDDEIPEFELAADGYFEENDPHQRRDEEALSNTYLRLLFENYEEETVREVLGDEYEEKKLRYNQISEDSHQNSTPSSNKDDLDSPGNSNEKSNSH